MIWRVRIWPVTLGFDRRKTTPDRSTLAAGCTNTKFDVFVLDAVLDLAGKCL